MKVNLFTFVDLYGRALRTSEHLLAKGVAHAKIVGASEGEMLEWRLIEDMQPLRFQFTVVCNFAPQWLARAAGVEVPKDIGDGLDVAGLRAAITASRAFLDRLKPDQFAGRDDVPLTVTIGTGMSPTMPIGQWLSVFATTNLYFHLSTAYGILRARGTPIGKIDLFASGL